MHLVAGLNLSIMVFSNQADDEQPLSQMALATAFPHGYKRIENLPGEIPGYIGQLHVCWRPWVGLGDC